MQLEKWETWSRAGLLAVLDHYLESLHVTSSEKDENSDVSLDTDSLLSDESPSEQDFQESTKAFQAQCKAQEEKGQTLCQILTDICQEQIT